MKKLIPTKTSNYADLIKDNSFYVDKTNYIELLENSRDKYIFFLRPRRFGKSLLLSMLEFYYGVQYKDQFDKLFGEYYIGQPENVTVLRNSYYILKFNFSGIKTDDSELIEKEFNAEVYTSILKFMNTHKVGTRKDKEYIKTLNSGTELLRNFFTIFSDAKPLGKIYILIDEYDHFTNDLFSFNPDHFKDIVSRNGWVRKFYEVIKQYAGEGIVDRFFGTGVTPVTLDSMTSGFNIAYNITLDLMFHNLAGFTELELKELIIGTIYEEGKFDLDKLLTDMRAWFNGSRFSKKSKEKLYNPQLVISFLTSFQSTLEYPQEVTDFNVTSDWTKIRNILTKLPKEDRDSILNDVYIKEEIKSGLSNQFNLEMPYTITDAISILFYNGLLTIKEEKYGIVYFVVPNYVIKTIYWEYLRALLVQEHQIKFNIREIGDIFEQMASAGKIDLLIEEVSKIMEPLINYDYVNFSESNLKMIVISILSLNMMFIIDSEREVSSGRVDLLLTKYDPYNSKYQFLLEFKYIKMKDEKLSITLKDGTIETKYEKTKREGIAQLKKYMESEYIKSLENLKSYLIIFRDKRKGEVISVK
jgi:hypothetical protein